MIVSSLIKPLKPVYLIYGDEPLFIIEAIDAIRAAARAQGYDERNSITLDGDTRTDDALQGLYTASLFSEQRLIEVTLLKYQAAHTAAMLRLAQSPPESSVCVFLCPNVDKAQQKSAWFTALMPHCTLIDCKKITYEAFPAWITQRLATQEQSLTPDALAFFVDATEGNILAAKQEIEKLALLAPKGRLDLSHLETALAQLAKFDTFKLESLWMSGALDRVLRMLATLEQEGESPVLLIWSLSEDLRQLLRFSAGRKKGESTHALVKSLRLWGDKQTLYPKVAQAISAKQLMAALQACAHIDAQIKGVAPGNPWESLRMLFQSHLFIKQPQ